MSDEQLTESRSRTITAKYPCCGKPCRLKVVDDETVREEVVERDHYQRAHMGCLMNAVRPLLRIILRDTPAVLFGLFGRQAPKVPPFDAECHARWQSMVEAASVRRHDDDDDKERAA